MSNEVVRGLYGSYSFDEETPTAGFTNPMTTVGDMIRGTTAGAAERFGIGTEKQLLAAISGVPTWFHLYEVAISVRGSGVLNVSRGIASLVKTGTGEYTITLNTAFARNLGVCSVYAGGAATLPANALQAKAFISNTVASTTVVAFTGFDDGTGTGVITPADGAFDLMIMRF